MKKIFALLLTLALLLPVGLVPAAGAAEPVTAEPFYALGWSDFDETKYPYLDGLVTTSFSNIGDKARLSHGGVTLMYGSYTDEQVTNFAEAMKKTMEARPEGTRYWHVFGPSTILKLAPKNVLYLDHGVTQLKDLMTSVFKKMSEIGCPLDGIVVDTEYISMGAWYIYADNKNSTDHYQKNKYIYAQIVADPRYATEVRPLLAERGFPFWTDITATQSEIFSICYTNKGEEYDVARNIWNTVMRIRLNQYVNDWCYNPLKTYYPEASLSDYQSHDSKAWLKLSAITDDGVALNGGSSIRSGTASCFSYYYARPGSSFFENMSQYASFNDAVYEASPFNSLLYDVNFTRHMYQSTDTRQIAPWITSYVYGSQKDCSMAYTPYYTELLYHLGLFDPEPFLSYTYVNEYQDEGATKVSYTAKNYLLTQQIMNDIMAELTRVAGYSDRKPIEMDQYWNTEFVLSGMYANGRNIWRITPNTDEVSLADFKVEGTDPTFSVKGRTVTFPGGRIIEDTPIATAGSCGYWVETDANVTPVITHDPDRYAKYPSLYEDFDDCTEGIFLGTSIEPADTWTRAGTVNIVANGSGKALALTGDASVRNVRLPAKITAGDTYAEDQVWEITVTIPEGLSAETVITLLRYAGSGQDTSDGGFKIQGGKVYGSENGEYKELTDLSAGTYTFKRVMNFNNKEAYTASYYVYGADGKELGKAEALAVPVFETVNAISCSTEKADKDVLMDDYKLYPTGIAADFELYDAATGMSITGDAKNTARDRSTAYRLSWLNGSDTEKYMTVMAAIYQDGALVEEKAIEEVHMQPGYDHVETGEVAVAQGQTVKVYLMDGRVASPDAPQGEKAPIDPMVIVLVAAIVVSVAAVVIALVVTRKPAKKEDKPQEPKAEE